MMENEFQRITTQLLVVYCNCNTVSIVAPDNFSLFTMAKISFQKGANFPRKNIFCDHPFRLYARFPEKLTFLTP